MKKGMNFMCMLMTTMALNLGIVSCGSDGDSDNNPDGSGNAVKLQAVHESSTSDDDSDTYTIAVTYDSNGRIATYKDSDFGKNTYTYSNTEIKVSNSKGSEYTYKLSNGIIQQRIANNKTINHTYENGCLTLLNGDGIQNPISFEWQNGNIIKCQNYFNYEYTYSTIPFEKGHIGRSMYSTYIDWALMIQGFYGECPAKLPLSSTSYYRGNVNEIVSYEYTTNKNGYVTNAIESWNQVSDGDQWSKYQRYEWK